MRTLVVVYEKICAVCTEPGCVMRGIGWTSKCTRASHLIEKRSIQQIAPRTWYVRSDGAGTGPARAAATRLSGKVIVVETDLGAELPAEGRVPSSEETLEQSVLRVAALAEKARRP